MRRDTNFLYIPQCVQWCRGSWQLWGKKEDEWEATDKGTFVYSGNTCLSLESAYIFSRVFELVCVFMQIYVHLN